MHWKGLKMKKKINTNTNKLKKNIIIIVVILIFLLFTCSSIILIERDYFFIEKCFKSITNKINSYVVSTAYNVNDFSFNVISSKIKYLEKENNELRKTINLSENENEYVVGEVINHNMKNWFDKVEVSKGYSNGIKKGDVVISPDGLIGFVSKVSKKMCEVRLITDVSSRNMVSVIIETKDGNVSGVLKEYDSKTGLFKVYDVVSKNNISKDDKVVLSGFDNDSYKGIYVGKVVKEETSNYGLSKTVWIESSINFDDLLFVIIVKEKN